MSIMKFDLPYLEEKLTIRGGVRNVVDESALAYAKACLRVMNGIDENNPIFSPGSGGVRSAIVRAQHKAAEWERRATAEAALNAEMSAQIAGLKDIVDQSFACTKLNKHSPMPWSSDDGDIVDANGGTLWFSNSCPGENDRLAPTLDQVEANARLVISAPKMLAALRMAEKMLCAQEDALRKMGCDKPDAESAILTVRAIIAEVSGTE